MAAVFFGVTTRIYNYSHTMGRNESNGTGFRLPVDMALGDGGKVYVLNRGTEYRSDSVRVTMLNMDEDYLGEFGRQGRGKGQFIWPSSISLDSGGNVYVSDEYLHRISVFNGQGEFLDSWGSEGSGDGELNRPSGFAFDKEDNLYVVDSANNRVQVFTKEGKLLAKWGKEGNGEGEFNLPWGITVDGKGDVWVVDWRNDRVQKFTPDGTFLASFGSSGDGIGQFNRPTDIAVDKDGDFYVVDCGNNRVEAFTPEGRFITAFTGDAGLSRWAEEQLKVNPDQTRQQALVQDKGPWQRFWHPIAIEIDDEQRIYVVDCKRCRLQVYQKTS